MLKVGHLKNAQDTEKKQIFLKGWKEMCQKINVMK